jgi:hypothetical protein
VELSLAGNVAGALARCVKEARTLQVFDLSEARNTYSALLWNGLRQIDVEFLIGNLGFDRNPGKALVGLVQAPPHRGPVRRRGAHGGDAPAARADLEELDMSYNGFGDDGVARALLGLDASPAMDALALEGSRISQRSTSTQSTDTRGSCSSSSRAQTRSRT